MLATNPSCPACGAASETALHVLRDCTRSRNLWMRTVPPSAAANFFIADLRPWIVQNINSQLSLGVDEPLGPLSLLRSYGKFGSKEMSSLRSLVDSRPGRVPARIALFKYGWLGGFMKSVGPTSVLQAELVSIYEGLQVAWSLGIPRLLIQSDCSQAIKLVNAKGARDIFIPLVRAIVDLRNRAWETTFVWIPRTGNMIADRLAKLAPTPCHDLVHVNSPLELTDKRV
ncbi:hypothetical protein F3Y22_tig00001644pilonHSYRG00563 [Hibiscus syriacus]|uniref:RNase H type-1 domain-containing protein n=1 Tax=Hibiscus syriacus TaxID=106335 RepID=A0A6A3CU34_HIBSY|nr:hypothetical protein F3Y22_tig00001644pilonHSYRG00563 [Hibiscus syriacus]